MSDQLLATTDKTGDKGLKEDVAGNSGLSNQVKILLCTIMLQNTIMLNYVCKLQIFAYLLLYFFRKYMVA